MVVSGQSAPPDIDRVFAALADHTRRDIVRRALRAEEGVLELASHYPMSFAAVQKHVAVLERAGLITKQRIGRRKVVRTNREALLVARRLLDQYEELWRARINRMTVTLSAWFIGALDEACGWDLVRSGQGCVERDTLPVSAARTVTVSPYR